jgi:glyoxylase-like metal-dependent hydrolase (beta-lactamase superfamily II)
MKPVLPTMAFERTMTLYRRDREIQLLYLGRAHTEGDVFVYLPKEKVIITGDAVIGWTPFMGDGYPEDWVTTLDRLAELPWDTLIMGHGEPAGGTGSGPSAATSTTWPWRYARKPRPARAWTTSSSA